MTMASGKISDTACLLCKLHVQLTTCHLHACVQVVNDAGKGAKGAKRDGKIKDNTTLNTGDGVMGMHYMTHCDSVYI